MIGKKIETTALQTAEAVPGLPRDEGGPVFREPWEAQAFALAVALNERGLFTWSEWAAALGEEIKRAQAAGDPDLGNTYYRALARRARADSGREGRRQRRDAGTLPRRVGPRRRSHPARQSDRIAGGGFSEVAFTRHTRPCAGHPRLGA